MKKYYLTVCPDVGMFKLIIDDFYSRLDFLAKNEHLHDPEEIVNELKNEIIDLEETMQKSKKNNRKYKFYCSPTFLQIFNSIEIKLQTALN